MKKRRLLKIVAIFSVLFLVLQFILYKTVYKQNAEYLKPKFKVKNEDKLRLLKLFLEISARHSTEVILVESSILTSVATNIASKFAQCAHLCHNSNVITFAIHGSKEEKTAVINDYISEGFSLATNFVKKSVTLPTDLSSNQQLPSHYFLFHSGLLLHLVVFYTRGENFVWSGRVLFEAGSKPPWFRLNALSYGPQASALNSFETQNLEIDKLTFSVPKNILKFVYDLGNSTFLECNNQRAENFYNKYPKDTSPPAVHFQKKGRQLLAKAKEILDALEIPFWLSSGTCLGWYRQCGIIPYSKDVDIGISIKHYKEGLTERFEEKGFLLKHQFGRLNDSFELSYQLGEVKLDIFFFYEEAKYTWNGGTHAWTGQKYKYIFPKFTLCWTTLLELKVRVPCETKSYIMANYGDNWFVPVKDWQWNKSPPNVKPNGMWPTKEWDKLIQVYD